MIKEAEKFSEQDKDVYKQHCDRMEEEAMDRAEQMAERRMEHWAACSYAGIPRDSSEWYNF